MHGGIARALGEGGAAEGQESGRRGDREQFAHGKTPDFLMFPHLFNRRRAALFPDTFVK